MTTLATPPTPISTESETLARDTFTALMWALSYPGRAAQLPTSPASMATIGNSLLDLETTFFTPDEALAAVLARTGARSAAVEAAAYHFFSATTDPQAMLAAIANASIGTLLYPDQSATLVIAVTLGRGQRLRLSGPGIQSSNELLIDDLPAVFWTLRSERNQYPLGWDVFFVDGEQVVGLPRTTVVDAD